MEIFYRVFPIAESILEVCLQLHFFTLFIGKKARFRHYISILLLYELIIFMAQQTESSHVGILLITLALFLLGVGSLKADWGLSLLSAVQISGVIQLCYGITGSIIGILSPFLHRAESSTFIYGGIILSFLMSLLTLVMAYLICFFICRYFSVTDYRENKNLLMILVPMMLIFMISEYVNQTVYGRTATLDEQGNLLGAVHPQMLLLEILCLFSIFCFLYVYRRCMLSFALDYKMSMLKQESGFQKKYVEEAKQRYDRTASFRHDIRNHFLIIGGLLEKGELQEAKKYVGTLNDMSFDMSFSYRTGSPVLDILLDSKLGFAKEKGIQAECFFEVPGNCRIADIDFCIMLSNALDNAVCACSSLENAASRYLKLSGSRQGDFFMIQVENSCVGGKNNVEYGIGLMNIRTAAEKYNGILKIERETGRFRLCILLLAFHNE